MTAKEYLQRLHRMDIALQLKFKEVQELREMAQQVGGMDYSKERVQTSGTQDAPFADPIGKIHELEKEIKEELDRYIDERINIVRLIWAIENKSYMQILYMRYVEFKPFDAIATTIGATIRHTQRLHGEALSEFEREHTQEISE